MARPHDGSQRSVSIAWQPEGMRSPKDKPYKCNECGERFTHRHSSQFGDDLGTDSVSHHQKVTGHSQQRNPARTEYVDFTVAGEKSGRLTASQQDRATGQYFARCACGRMTSIAQDLCRSYLGDRATDRKPG